MIRILGTLGSAWLFGTAFMWADKPAALVLNLVVATATMALWPLSLFRPGLRHAVVVLGIALLASTALFAGSLATLASNMVAAVIIIATGLSPDHPVVVPGNLDDARGHEPPHHVIAA